MASEGFPKVVHEALACNLPVVTTKVSVLPRLLKAGGGLALDTSITPKVLAEAILNILENPKLYETMAIQAGKTANHYSLEAWSEKIKQHIDESWFKHTP
jgi:glycosyltransferase involved in cell wall biosynthesis